MYIKLFGFDNSIFIEKLITCSFSINFEFNISFYFLSLIIAYCEKKNDDEMFVVGTYKNK